MRLALVIASLGSGGAERVLSILANHWARAGHEVHLLTLDAAEPFYALAPGVRHERLALRRPARGMLAAVAKTAREARGLRRVLARVAPDAILSFIDRTNVLTLLAQLGRRVPVVVSERVDPERHAIGSRWEHLRRRVYRRADAIVVQTEAVARRMPAALRPKVHVLPNPVPVPDAPEGAGERSGGPRVVAMGRLAPQKGFDLLLRAFARASAGRAAWRLEIWGEGPARAELEALAAELGLAGRVRFAGRTTRPGEALAAADVFVLSSRYEGFPNVLCEAMALGRAVVAFDCPSGPAEIVRSGRDGVLVPPEDVAALADALGRLMDDTAERCRLGEEARGVARRFDVAAVAERWLAVLAGGGGRPEGWKSRAGADKTGP